jgi:hypothetical protein
LLNKERESEEAKIARGDSDDEPVLLMAYESDEPVKLTFSDSEEYSENESEVGVKLYDSESEDEESSGESEDGSDSEDSKDESESEWSFVPFVFIFFLCTNRMECCWKISMEISLI